MASELKWHDISHSDTVISSTGRTFGTVVGLEQGKEASQRIGRSCVIRSIAVRYRLELIKYSKAAVSLNNDCVRIIIFLDRQCNGTQIATTDLLAGTGIRSHLNVAEEDRFIILCDKLHNLKWDGIASETDDTVSSPAVLEEYSYFKEVVVPVEYSGASDDVSDITSNNIGMFIISEGNRSGWLSTTRIRYNG